MIEKIVYSQKLTESKGNDAVRMPAMASSILASSSSYPSYNAPSYFATPVSRTACFQIIDFKLAFAGNFGVFGQIRMKQPRVAERALSAARASMPHHKQVVVTNETHPQKLSLGGWKSFVETVSGKWDGYGADFNCDGKPLELPAAVVPDAYHEWGVDVYDWQTQCSTLGDKENGSFFYKNIRLYPTVGCEADAATTYSVEERKIEAGSPSGILAFHQSGCYMAVWPGKGINQESKRYPSFEKIASSTNGVGSWEVEHCLVEAGKQEISRVRILHEFISPRSPESLPGWPSLRKITIYRESREGPFRNGESLGGCSNSVSGFATNPPLEPALLHGSWHVKESICHFNDVTAECGETKISECVVELTSGASKVAERELSDKCIFLPKGMWSIISVNKAGYLHVESGWLVNPNKAMLFKTELLVTGEIQKVTLSADHRLI